MKEFIIKVVICFMIALSLIMAYSPKTPKYTYLDANNRIVTQTCELESWEYIGGWQKK